MNRPGLGQWLCLAAAVGCISCGGGHPPVESVPPIVAKYPPFPTQLPSAPRQGAGLEQINLSDWAAASSRTQFLSAPDDHVEINPSGQDPGWVVYDLVPFGVFGSTSELQTASLSVDLSIPSQQPPTRVFIAYADFNRQAWVWQELGDSSLTHELPLPDGSAALAPDCQLYIALLAWEGSASLQSASLHFKSSTQLDRGPADYSAVHLIWTPQLGAESYHLYYGAGLEPASYALLADLPADAHSFDHSAANPPAHPCTYSSDYSYVLRTVIGGKELAACDPLHARRELAQPEYFYASDGVTKTGIHLDWSPVAGATGYRIYMDAQPAAVFDVDAQTLSLMDSRLQVLDGGQHFYTCRAYGTEGEGASGTDSGYCFSALELPLDAEADAGATQPALMLYDPAQGSSGICLASYDPVTGNLFFAASPDVGFASSAELAWYPLTQLSAGADVQISLAQIGSSVGLLAVSSLDGVRFGHAAKAQPQSVADWTVSSVDNSPGCREGSLADNHGTPACSYCSSGGALVYAAADQAFPQSDTDWHSIVVDNTGQTGRRSRLLVPDTACIFYVQTADADSNPTQQLRMAHAALAAPQLPADFTFVNLAPGVHVSGQPWAGVEQTLGGARLKVIYGDADAARARFLATASMLSNADQAGSWQSLGQIYLSTEMGTSAFYLQPLPALTSLFVDQRQAVLEMRSDGTQLFKLSSGYSPFADLVRFEDTLSEVDSGPVMQGMSIATEASGRLFLVFDRQVAGTGGQQLLRSILH